MRHEPYVAPQVEREDPDPVVRQRVRILGRFNVSGHEPGSTATLKMRRAQLDVLIKAGLVEVIAAPATTRSDVAKSEKENGDGQVGSA